MLVTSSIMEILIIRVPAGEQISILNHIIDTDEALIGQNSHCQVVLPDRTDDIAERHGRIFRQDEYWYLENLSDRRLLVNSTEIAKGSSRRYLLSDGDIIFCGAYHLMVSNFSPWQTAFAKTTDDNTEPTPISIFLPSDNHEIKRDQLDDPFANVELENAHNETFETSDTLWHSSGRNSSMFIMPCDVEPKQKKEGLIDVLAEDDDDQDWSISRNLWSHSEKGQADMEQNVPILSIPAGDNKKLPYKKSEHKQSICRAMLESLDKFLDDIHPDILAEQFITQSANSESVDCWLEYKKFYQQVLNDRRYRLLFLQRFRQALKRQKESF